MIIAEGFPASYEQEAIDAETAGLPSQKNRDAERAKEAKEAEEEARQAEEAKREEMLQDSEMKDTGFDPVKFLSEYKACPDGVCAEWDAAAGMPKVEENNSDDGPPPRIAKFSADDFASDANAA